MGAYITSLPLDPWYKVIKKLLNFLYINFIPMVSYWKFKLKKLIFESSKFETSVRSIFEWVRQRPLVETFGNWENGEWLQKWKTSNGIIAGNGRGKFTFELIFVLFSFFRSFMIIPHYCMFSLQYSTWKIWFWNI